MNENERIILGQQMTDEIKKVYPYVRFVNIFSSHFNNQVVIIGDWSINNKEFIKYIEEKYNLSYSHYESYSITCEDAIIFYPKKS